MQEAPGQKENFVFKRETTYRSIRKTSVSAFNTVVRQVEKVQDRIMPKYSTRLRHSPYDSPAIGALTPSPVRQRSQFGNAKQKILAQARKLPNLKRQKQKDINRDPASYYIMQGHIGPATPDTPVLETSFTIDTPGSTGRVMSARKSKTIANKRIHEIMSPRRLPFSPNCNRNEEIGYINTQMAQINALADKISNTRLEHKRGGNVLK